MITRSTLMPRLSLEFRPQAVSKTSVFETAIAPCALCPVYGGLGVLKPHLKISVSHLDKRNDF